MQTIPHSANNYPRLNQRGAPSTIQETNMQHPTINLTALLHAHTLKSKYAHVEFLPGFTCAVICTKLRLLLAPLPIATALPHRMHFPCRCVMYPSYSRRRRHRRLHPLEGDGHALACACRHRGLFGNVRGAARVVARHQRRDLASQRLLKRHHFVCVCLR